MHTFTLHLPFVYVFADVPVDSFAMFYELSENYMYQLSTSFILPDFSEPVVASINADFYKYPK